MQRRQVQSPFRELKSHMPCGQKKQNIKQKQYCSKFNKGFKKMNGFLHQENLQVCLSYELWKPSCCFKANWTAEVILGVGKKDSILHAILFLQRPGLMTSVSTLWHEASFLVIHYVTSVCFEEILGLSGHLGFASSLLAIFFFFLRGRQGRGNNARGGGRKSNFLCTYVYFWLECMYGGQNVQGVCERADFEYTQKEA